MEKYTNERVLSAFSHLVDLLFRVKPHSKWKLLYLFYEITWFCVDAARTLTHIDIFFDGRWVHSHKHGYLVNFNQRVDYSWRFEMINYNITLLLWDDLMANVVAFYMFLTTVLYQLNIYLHLVLCAFLFEWLLFIRIAISIAIRHFILIFSHSLNRFVFKRFIFLFIIWVFFTVALSNFDFKLNGKSAFSLWK